MEITDVKVIPVDDEKLRVMTPTALVPVGHRPSAQQPDAPVPRGEDPRGLQAAGRRRREPGGRSILRRGRREGGLAGVAIPPRWGVAKW